MPRFFFHVVRTGHRVEDTIGVDAPDLDHAIAAVRAVSLDQLEQEERAWPGWHFEVTDDAARVLTDTPFAAIISRGRPG
ncbi:DUF6894 family protein [Faunimonas sp. B44]|uniref:DUF6894 family protein n=1 Tax=Faunimonas sp. B44 TaxID=3461493 RepID=UPI0040445268